MISLTVDNYLIVLLIWFLLGAFLGFIVAKRLSLDKLINMNGRLFSYSVVSRKSNNSLGVTTGYLSGKDFNAIRDSAFGKTRKDFPDNKIIYSDFVEIPIEELREILR